MTGLGLRRTSVQQIVFNPKCQALCPPTSARARVAADSLPYKAWCLWRPASTLTQTEMSPSGFHPRLQNQEASEPL